MAPLDASAFGAPTPLSSLVAILDEQHLVSRFVVNQVIHELSASSPARTRPAGVPLLSDREMPHGIVVGYRDTALRSRSMSNPSP